MDPNKVLAELRTMTAAVLETADEVPGARHTDMTVATLVEISEKFEALDEWLTGGGFKPGAWR